MKIIKSNYTQTKAVQLLTNDLTAIVKMLDYNDYTHKWDTRYEVLCSLNDSESEFIYQTYFL